jgi:hypothetical protein
MALLYLSLADGDDELESGGTMRRSSGELRWNLEERRGRMMAGCERRGRQ